MACKTDPAAPPVMQWAAWNKLLRFWNDDEARLPPTTTATTTEETQAASGKKMIESTPSSGTKMIESTPSSAVEPTYPSADILEVCESHGTRYSSLYCNLCDVGRRDAPPDAAEGSVEAKLAFCTYETPAGYSLPRAYICADCAHFMLLSMSILCRKFIGGTTNLVLESLGYANFALTIKAAPNTLWEHSRSTPDDEYYDATLKEVVNAVHRASRASSALCVLSNGVPWQESYRKRKDEAAKLIQQATILIRNAGTLLQTKRKLLLDLPEDELEEASICARGSPTYEVGFATADVGVGNGYC